MHWTSRSLPTPIPKVTLTTRKKDGSETTIISKGRFQKAA